MTDIRGKTVTSNVASPLKLCRIGVTGAYVASLQLLELLLCAKLVCLDAREG
jgi:hypothetical protein